MSLPSLCPLHCPACTSITTCCCSITFNSPHNLRDLTSASPCLLPSLLGSHPLYLFTTTTCSPALSHPSPGILVQRFPPHHVSSTPSRSQRLSRHMQDLPRQELCGERVMLHCLTLLGAGTHAAGTRLPSRETGSCFTTCLNIQRTTTGCPATEQGPGADDRRLISPTSRACSGPTSARTRQRAVGCPAHLADTFPCQSSSSFKGEIGSEKPTPKRET